MDRGTFYVRIERQGFKGEIVSLPVERAIDSYLTTLAARIIETAKESKYAETARQFDWEVSVIKDDQTQISFALPGGKIAVYMGILLMAKNEAGLAANLGHEITHALARHGAERMSQGLIAQIVMTGA
jgi:predicted Zn-dependent protease